MITELAFKPLTGCSSKHLQTILPVYWPAGPPVPCTELLVDIGKGDRLSCQVSTPPKVNAGTDTVVLVHGLGGSHHSSYMIRISRKLHEAGIRTVSVNLRNCGSGRGMTKLPYNAGNSDDVLAVLKTLKTMHPESPLTLVGFSLGGNISLKLAGELKKSAASLLKQIIAICPPLDLAETLRLIQKKRNRLYHRYYLRNILNQASGWINRPIKSIREYDEYVTSQAWGYKDAADYYQHNSSKWFIPEIACPTQVLFAKDDPFINFKALDSITIPPSLSIWCTKHGGHMGFIGQTKGGEHYFWMDEFVLSLLVRRCT